MEHVFNAGIAGGFIKQRKTDVKLASCDKASAKRVVEWSYVVKTEVVKFFVETEKEQC